MGKAKLQEKGGGGGGVRRAKAAGGSQARPDQPNVEVEYKVGDNVVERMPEEIRAQYAQYGLAANSLGVVQTDHGNGTMDITFETPAGPVAITVQKDWVQEVILEKETVEVEKVVEKEV